MGAYAIKGVILPNKEIPVDWEYNSLEFPPGDSGTTIDSKIQIGRGTPQQDSEALYHETFHSDHNPRGLFETQRQYFSMMIYEESNLFRFLEEAGAECAAQRLSGGNITNGVSFPFSGNYDLTPFGVAVEATAIMESISLIDNALTELIGKFSK